MHTKASGIGSHHQSTTDKTKINYYQNLGPHKSATSGGCTSTKHMIHGTRTVCFHLPLLLTPAPPLVGFRSMGCSHNEIIRKGK